jgi:hypothetical protein
LALVGKEHHAELADHGIEHAVGKRQRLRIGLLPGDAARRDLRGSVVDHRLVQIGRDDRDAARQRVQERARDNAGARGGLQNARRIESRQPLREVLGIGFKDQRAEVLVVERRNRS